MNIFSIFNILYNNPSSCYNFIMNYINDKYGYLHLLFQCGMRPYKNLFIYSFIYKNKIVRIPIKPLLFHNNNIIDIKYKKFEMSKYISDDVHTLYIKSFLTTKYANINISPDMIGYHQLMITYLDEELNETTKEYLHNEIIQ